MRKNQKEWKATIFWKVSTYYIFNQINDLEQEKEFSSIVYLKFLLQDLSLWIKDRLSKNGRQNVEARVKVGITLYYMAHGGDGINLGCMSGLKNNSALKYLHQVTETICTHLAPKWMGNSHLNRSG